MKTNVLVDEDYDETPIGFGKSPDLRQALALLGENWQKGTAEDFAVSFISPINALYGNLLAAWPKEVAPEESLVLLSRDIETHLRQYAQDNKIEYFGLSMAKDGDTPSSIPYSWLYDLRQGAKILFTPDQKPSSKHGLWIGFASLEAVEIEKYKELERKQQQEAVSDQALDRLDLWQRQFVHMLNTAMADMAQNGLTSMTSLSRTIGSLLHQGRALAKAIAQGRGQTIERRLEGGEIKTETDNMRQAILSQLADTTLPETIRAALRQQLKSLNEATKDQAAPLNAARTVAKSGLVIKSDKVISLAAFAAAYKALTVDRRSPENRLLSTPAALAARASVTAINTNAETVREILALLSDKNQPKDVREIITGLVESGQPLTVRQIISALADKGHATAISDVMSALADKGQMAGVRMVAVALAETGQQTVINKVVTALAESNPQIAAQALAVFAENHQQIAAQTVTALVETQPSTTVQTVIHALAAIDQKATVQIVTALSEIGQPAVLNTVFGTLAEGNQQVAAQALAALTESHPQIATQVITTLAETQPLTTVQAMINALAENNQQATIQIISALAETGQPIILNAVIATLVETQPTSTIEAVINALAKTNHHGVVQVVAPLAESNRLAAAVQALSTVIETQPSTTVQAVINALAGDNPQTTIQIITALAETAKSTVVNAAVISLADGNPQFAAQAIVLLADSNQQSAAHALKGLLETQPPQTVQTVIAALANTNQPATINAVIIALTKSDPQTAIQTITALAEAGQFNLLNRVVTNLTENNQQAAAQAVAAVIANNNPQTIMHAVAALAESQTPKNWQTAVAEKIQDIGAVVGNISAHITETFRDAANYVTAFAAQANNITAPESKFQTSTPNPVVVDEFRTTSKGICPFCKDNIISNIVGNVFGERTKNVYDLTIGAAGKTVSTLIGSILKRPTSKGMLDGMKANLNL